ncbi:hypothetical protein VTN77DRAFT_1829 [Rasamsonia byssochlamydoides]|uniref:uncharacterized protein n=1 Tax=Rasamsonia byssochlamydoides TaxID=89139 RepID=UPI003741E91C
MRLPLLFRQLYNRILVLLTRSKCQQSVGYQGNWHEDGWAGPARLPLTAILHIRESMIVRWRGVAEALRRELQPQLAGQQQ